MKSELTQTTLAKLGFTPLLDIEFELKFPTLLSTYIFVDKSLSFIGYFELITPNVVLQSKSLVNGLFTPPPVGFTLFAIKFKESNYDFPVIKF
jgi:hypothetical protein